jgi:hypothetical protein
MKAPEPPPTPDPYKTASAQQVANVEVAKANSVLQNADEDRPDGTVRFIQTGDSYPVYTYDASGNILGTQMLKRWKKTVALTVRGQEQFIQQQDVAIAMNGAALIQAGHLTELFRSPFSRSMLPILAATPGAPILLDTMPTLGYLTVDIGTHADVVREVEAVRHRLMERLLWQQELDRDQAVEALRHKGIVEGMEAWERTMRPFDRMRIDARLQVDAAAAQEHTRLIGIEQTKAAHRNEVIVKQWQIALQSVEFRNQVRAQQFTVGMQLAQFVNATRATVMQEILTERSQVVNEISSLTHGQQVRIPEGQPFRAGAIAQTPVGEYVYRSAAMDMQKWEKKSQQQQQMMGGMMGLAGSLLAMPMTGGGSVGGGMMAGLMG